MPVVSAKAQLSPCCNPLHFSQTQPSFPLQFSRTQPSLWFVYPLTEFLVWQVLMHKSLSDHDLLFLFLCRHLSESQRINYLTSLGTEIQTLSASALLVRCFVVPSATTSPVLPLFHSPLLYILFWGWVSAPSCPRRGPFLASQGGLKEKTTKIHSRGTGPFQVLWFPFGWPCWEGASSLLHIHFPMAQF